ncbi:MAG: molybdate ABC transporter substrate-binding protein [Chloroflexi bacterium]|nr:molybdate ABC transporter substrate-binding protein [Chloroflexota bacterium]
MAWRATGAIMAIALIAGLAGCRARAKEAPVTVFAAASLEKPFREAISAFEEAHPGLKVRLNLAGSQHLRAQLEQGARADVFASADERQMDLARQAGLLAVAPQEFTRNSLVVVTPAANPGKIERLADLASPGKRLVLAHNGVPAGAYGIVALEAMSRDAAYGPDFARRVLANVASQEEDVKFVLAKVLLGEADAGVVYQTDVTLQVRDKLLTILIPSGFQPSIGYQVAVLKGAGHPQDAARFVGYLLSPEGQALLTRHGFLPLR